MDRNNVTPPELNQQQKPVKRMEKIRRSLSFRRKKKSDKLSKQLTMNGDSPVNNLPSSISAPINVNNNNNSSSSASANVSKSNSTTTQALVANHHTTIVQGTTMPPTTNSNSIQSDTAANNTNAAAPATTPISSVAKPPHWIEDEKKVRAGNCSFQVKYLGSSEVSDSRGMHLCEMAIEKLLAEKEKKKPLKAILYVSGDSLRVVDETNKTLLVDQTIEKVSFCAPDRHHENGFAYICRDGTTRRWLCHCFMATKETLKNSSTTGQSGTGCSGGERLSHAVGCAFSVCLEKKQKRERENVTMEVGPNHSFTRMGSFRQASLTERLEDPQIVMPANNPVPMKPVDNPHAIERPRANPDAFNRQNSLRGSGVLQLPFKRNSAAYTSLKPGELPSFQQQKITSGLTLTNGSSTQSTKTSLLMQQHQLNQNSNNTNTVKVNPIATSQNVKTISNTNTNINNNNDIKKINTISEVPEEQFSLNTNSNLQTNTKLSEQLNIQTSSEQFNHFNSPVTPLSTHPTTTATTAAAYDANNDWPNNNNYVQQQPKTFFQINSTILATPQSNPATPLSNCHPVNAVSPPPPPLPPMPIQYQSPVSYYQNHNHPINQQQNQNQQNYMYQHQNLKQMYQQNAMNPLVNMMPMLSLQQNQQPYQNQTNVFTTPTVSSMASPTSVTTGETFEQKWARIQAAKSKTNPFAEDIAKKYEIKL